MAMDLENHPCFNAKVRKTAARVHLPVAPRCNMQCHYCNRDFDCVNESRPGVTTTVLQPFQALEYLKGVVAKNPAISVVGIAGPGDPFANAEETMETLRLIRKEYPDMLLCVATNGLNVLPYVEEIAELKVSHVTLTVNAVRPEIGERIYAWMRYNKRAHSGKEAAEYLWTQQAQAIAALKEAGVTVKINTIFVPGYNDHHIEEVAKTVSGLGADILNIIPLYPVKGTLFEKAIPPTSKDLTTARLVAQHYLPQMAHCQRCRADAVGFLGDDMKDDILDALRAAAKIRESHKLSQRPYVAVATREGLLINMHLGEATEMHIYEPEDNGRLVEVRPMPQPGGGDVRWGILAQTLADCRTVLVSGAGNRPIEILKANGITVHQVEGMVEAALEALKAGNSLEFMNRRTTWACGSECAGTGNGCG